MSVSASRSTSRTSASLAKIAAEADVCFVHPFSSDPPLTAPESRFATCPADMAPAKNVARDEYNSERSRQHEPAVHNPSPQSPRLERRQGGPIDQILPYPPPSFTPSFPLHASIIPYTGTDAAILPTGGSKPTGGPSPTTGSHPKSSSTSISTGTPQMSASLKPHGTNVGLLVGIIIAVSAILLLITAAVVRLLLKRKAGLRSTSARLRFSMFNPNAKPAAGKAGSGVAWAKREAQEVEKETEAENGQFVLISTSEEDVHPEPGKRRPEEETPPLEVLGRISSVFNDDEIDIGIRRHSSPAVFGDDADDREHEAFEEFLKPRPLSLPQMEHDSTRRVQRQKAAELAQMMRMQIVHTSGVPAASASSSRTSVASERPRSVINGLGIVHEADEQEVDIASTAVSALDEYGVAISPVSPPVRISELFQVDKEGKIVRLSLGSSSLTSPVTPLSVASDALPKTPISADSERVKDDDDSAHTGDSLEEDLESAVVVQMKQSKSVSMNFKRPILISVQTSKSMTISPPASHPAELRLSCPTFSPSASPSHSRSASPSAAASLSPSPTGTGMRLATSTSSTSLSAFKFPSPPPMLSPLLLSQTSFSDDISQSLEERVFAYRASGPWSRENYKLTTPGQIRALVDALALSRPAHLLDQREKSWPWPPYEVDR